MRREKSHTDIRPPPIPAYRWYLDFDNRLFYQLYQNTKLMDATIQNPRLTKKSPFSPEELSVFRSLIERKIASANEEIEFLQQSVREMRENRSADFSSSQHHFADLGSNEAAMDVNMRLLERTQTFALQLKRALKRIDSGTYGICKVTGKPIAHERLLAAPHTQHSMEAKLMRNRSLN